MTYAILKNITPVFFLFIFQLSFASSDLNLIKASQNFIEFQKEDKSVEKIIELFSKTSLEDVTNEIKTNDEKLAFWINVYNGFIQYTLRKNPKLYSALKALEELQEANLNDIGLLGSHNLYLAPQISRTRTNQVLDALSQSNKGQTIKEVFKDTSLFCAYKVLLFLLLL